MNILNRVLLVDKYAAIEQEAFLLESYYQIENKSATEKALECIILTLNPHNAVYLRELLERELWISFSVCKFKTFLDTFVCQPVEEKSFLFMLESFKPKIDISIMDIIAALNEKQKEIFFVGWSKIQSNEQKDT